VITAVQIRAAGIDWHVDTAGEGPPVLLLHGFPESRLSYRHNIEALVEAGFSVFVPDLKGYGLTDKPRPGSAYGDYRISVVSREIGLLIQALGFERMHVVGHDWGGVLLSAMMFTARERLDRCVLLNAPFWRFDPTTIRHIYRFQVPQLPERSFHRDPVGFVGGIFDTWSVRREACSAEDLRLYVRGFQTGGSFACAMAYYRNLRRDIGFVARTRMTGTPAGGFPPTMVCYGAGDPIMPPRVARWAAADIQGARLELIEGAGHFVHSEAPGRTNSLLIEHLSL
jgi:pimeloyl-ACP methyl ester carboxylesterase